MAKKAGEIIGVKPNPADDYGECKKHGMYKRQRVVFLGMEITAGCPGCDEEAERLRSATIERDMKISAESARIRMVDQSGVPRKFQESTVGSFWEKNPGMKKAKSMAQAFVDRFHTVQLNGGAMVLLGKNGNGKTLLGCGILMDVISRYMVSGIYVKAIDMIRDIRATYTDHSRTESSVIGKYVNAGLLVIDEVGKQYGTEGEKLLLFDIIDGRTNELKPTIYITNLTFPELENYLGVSSFDRINDPKHTVLVEFNWESARSGK